VGYVGLVTGTGFADLGNRVVCIDLVEEKIEKLRSGEMPIYEPGLEEMVRRNVQAGRLSFTTSYEEGLDQAEFAFVAVGTPSGEEGQAELNYVRMAAKSIAEHMKDSLIIVNKSTVPIGTGDTVAEIVRNHRANDCDFSVVSNPEFLREGSAVADFMNPDRIVLGSTDRKAAERVSQLYLPLRAPMIITDLRTAEMIKYASNAFLASRISFINEIASICEELGADIKEVAAGMGYDKRIGHAFLDAGLGFGGSCFPKDVRALAHMASVHGCHPQLLRAVLDINRDQRHKVIRKLWDTLGELDGKTIGLLGLAFKPNTDDMREAPSVEIAHLLRAEGANVRAYDPVAMDVARSILPEVTLCADPYDLAEGSDALVVVTEWNEFKHLDFSRIKALMREAVIIDGRNIYNPTQLREMGFAYQGIGRAADRVSAQIISSVGSDGAQGNADHPS
jgi:UDPglucose 6-dehydrogenase